MTRFSCGTELVMGKDSLDFLETLRASRVLLVTDKFFSESGTAKEILTRAGCPDGVIFDEVQPDPSAELAARGAAVMKQLQPELLIALGGGSSMDCAKGILLAAEHRPVFVAIPTTSGTGSEVTSFSILTHKGVKHALIDRDIRPDYAVLDPTLLSKIPPKLISESGMDAVSHCMEAFVSQNRSPLTDALAGEALHTLLAFLPRSLAGDMDAREAVHFSATMAGFAFDNAGLGVVHALAHALGGTHHIPHGRLCGILLPHVMDFNKSACSGQYAKLARMCGLGAATEVLAVRNLRNAILRLLREMKLPATLKEAGISSYDPDAIISAALADRCMAGNPRPATADDLMQILKEAAK